MKNEEKRLVAPLALEYIGGFKDQRKANGILKFYETYIEFKALLKPPMNIKYEDMAGIKVESPDDVSKRVTATRLLLVGIFAFAFKKSKKEAFIVMELTDGQEVIFHLNGMSQQDTRAKLSGVIAKVKSNISSTSTPNPSSVADELSKLAKLKDQGLLTDNEFTTQKNKLLGD